MAKAKEIEGLDCEAEAGAGINLVLRTRWEEMYALRPAALNRDEPGGVHDMRVASRRLRSALQDFMPYLHKRRLAPPSDKLKKIAGALGAVRDQDVAIKELKKLEADAPPEVLPGIMRYADDRREKRALLYADLAAVITEEALSKTQVEFLEALEHGVKSPRRGKKAGSDRGVTTGMSLREASHDIIRKRLGEVQDLSKSLYRPLKSGPLHRLRIAAKKLRYALELFKPCWGEPFGVWAEEVAELQTSLGELHDCDVWVSELGAQLSRQEKDNSLSPDAQEDDRQQKRAALWLLDHFTKARTKHFRDALERFSRWESDHFAAHLTERLREGLKTSEMPPQALTATDITTADLEALEVSSPDA